MIIKNYKIRIYPNNKQKVLLEKHFGANRWIYNYFLNKKIKVYQKEKKQVSCFQLINELPTLKKENIWLKDINAQSLQMSIRNIDNAFTRFFREKKGFPKFKSKRNTKNSFCLPQGNKVDFENRIISVVKIGKLKARFDRKFDGKIKSVFISKNSINQYYASITVETREIAVKSKKIEEKTTVGIDLGIKDFAVISDGRVIKNPKHLIKSEKRLKILHKRLSRKRKGSNNRRKEKHKLAKLYNKIKNQRSYFLHNLSYKLTHENQVNAIALETLNISGMIKNHCLAKSISDASWSEFVRQLEYKGVWYGVNILRIGRFEPSSKMCECGEINNSLTLKDREWKCKKCNKVNNRDLLASRNIKKFALQKQNLINTG